MREDNLCDALYESEIDRLRRFLGYPNDQVVETKDIGDQF